MDDSTHPERPSIDRNQESAGASQSASAVEALWNEFGRTSSEKAFCTTWLALQCHSIDGVACGIVLLGAPEENRPFVLTASWPSSHGDLRHLSEVAERALRERRGLVLKRSVPDPDGEHVLGEQRYDIAYPIQVSGQVYGIVALDVDSRPQAELRTVMRQLQWGSAWMEVLCRRGLAARDAAPNERLKTVVTLLAGVAGQKRFHGAAVQLASALATEFDCDRVSIGFFRRGQMRVEAVSHSGQFGKNTNLIRTVSLAMTEAAEQAAPVVFPQPEHRQPVVVRAHKELAAASGNSTICSIPLPGHEETIGAITLERSTGERFDDETVATTEALATLIAPVLDTLRRDDRWLGSKVLDSVVGFLGSLIGPRHLGLKLGALAAVVLVAFFVIATGTYRVTADTVIEPAERRAIVATYDGYLDSAPYRAGDVVAAGDALATLDDRTLRLERTRWQSQEDQSRRQYYDALGSNNAPQVQVFDAQIDQARAQVELLDEQIARTRITAPFDGVIVTGDLSQSLGAPVQRGEVLFELAPLDQYRVVLEVDERDIGDVTVGQTGELVLSGFTDESLPFVVERMTPVSTAEEGQNFFRVEARLESTPAQLRPGMEGVGKIEVDERKLWWIWTREIGNWIRLTAWKWLP